MCSSRLPLLSCVSCRRPRPSLFFFNDTATTEIYTLSLHDALPILSRAGSADWRLRGRVRARRTRASAEDGSAGAAAEERSEEHTSELQSPDHLVCRLLLEKKKQTNESAAHAPACVPIRRDPHV